MINYTREKFISELIELTNKQLNRNQIEFILNKQAEFSARELHLKNRVMFKDFISLTPRSIPARSGTNPQTHSVILIKAHLVVDLKLSKKLKEAIKGLV